MGTWCFVPFIVLSSTIKNVAKTTKVGLFDRALILVWIVAETVLNFLLLRKENKQINKQKTLESEL